MTDANIRVDSERSSFMMHWDIEKYDDGTRYLFCDELEDYIFYPYIGKLKNVPGYGENKTAFEDARIFLVNNVTGKLAKVPCNMLEEQKKIYITDNNFNKYWKWISEGIYQELRRKNNSMDDVTHASVNEKVNLTLVMTARRTAEINNAFVIEYKGKEKNIETQRLISKRASALENHKIRFVYAKSDNFVHDKTCQCVSKIPYWDFDAAEELPEDRELCRYCKKKIYIRNAIRNDAKHFSWYVRFFEKGNVGINVLERFLAVGGAKLYMPTVNQLQVKYKDDTWLISLNKKGRYILRHNNYVLVNEEERCITSGFHVQKRQPRQLSKIFAYIERYDWRVHLPPKMPIEEKETEQVVPVAAEEAEQKAGLWKRIVAWFEKVKNRSFGK